MKVKLFAIGVAMVALMFAACNQPVEVDGDVSLAANRPGAPSNVRLTLDSTTQKIADGNSAVPAGPVGAILRWTVGENASSHEIFLRLDENSIPIPDFGLFSGNSLLGDATWADRDLAQANGNIGYERNTTLDVTKRHISTGSNIYSLVESNPADAWKVGTPYQVGVRATSTVTGNGNFGAPSEIVWARNDDNTYQTVTFRAKL